jgi:hypothetical protein
LQHPIDVQVDVLAASTATILLSHTKIESTVRYLGIDIRRKADLISMP